MKSCPRCARSNEDDVQYCGRCGLNFSEYVGTQSALSDDAKFCYRHPKEATQLSCGRCEKPICTKCAIIGPAGPRCPDCAKQNIEFRPGAVVHQAKTTVRSVTKIGPWGIYALVMCVILIFNFVRGCSAKPARQTITPQEQEFEQKDGTK